MNIVDWVYACLIYVWSEIDKVAIGMGFTAYIVAILKGERSHREAMLCGVFATIAGTALAVVGSIIGIPSEGLLGFAAQGGGGLIAGAIGWYGTVRTVGYAEDKLGGKKDDSDEG